MSSCPGKSASRGWDGATAAWRNALAINEPQIKPGPENNNKFQLNNFSQSLPSPEMQELNQDREGFLYPISP